MDAAGDIHPSLEWLPALAVMVEHWDVRSQRAELTAGSAERYLRLFESFARYAASRGASRCGEVSERICDGYLNAALARWSSAAEYVDIADAAGGAARCLPGTGRGRFVQL